MPSLTVLDDQAIRAAAFTWLDEQQESGTLLFDRALLATFSFRGRPVRLTDPQRGIRRPAGMQAALSILTRFTADGDQAPYADTIGPDGYLRYKYRGDDLSQADNVALREAYHRRAPLVWFRGVARSLYVPIYPVWIVSDEPERLQFVLALDAAQRLLPAEGITDEEQRRYMQRLTRERLHQPVFRARVLSAYDVQCAVCRLRHAGLLDAAHILPDSHPNGTPVVPNGLALCKIHHAAYDGNLLAIRPDLVVEIRPDIRSERDGPMLRHGLQEMDGAHLHVPAARTARPDPERLAERYREFIRAIS